MIVLRDRNVNGLFLAGLQYLAVHGIRENSRNGPVIVSPTPVLSVYERPRERVLFSAKRDANPFFHLAEALWMLAGRDDSEYLNCYVKDFGARYAESDGVIHGAYGHRWRDAFGFDQLNSVVDKLRHNPRDRQCVVQMWDCAPLHNEPIEGSDDLLGDWKDRPCNTHVYLRVREDHALDLTICCRSNDIVWGAYGANAVHFSVLQEYLAGRIGVGVGRMYQFSNNYHAYEAMFNRMTEPDQRPLYDPYSTGDTTTLPMGTAWDRWDEDLEMYMGWHDLLWRGTNPTVPIYANSWFAHTASPMALANRARVQGARDEALLWADKVDAPDWRRAAIAWIERRKS